MQKGKCLSAGVQTEFFQGNRGREVWVKVYGTRALR